MTDLLLQNELDIMQDSAQILMPKEVSAGETADFCAILNSQIEVSKSDEGIDVTCDIVSDMAIGSMKKTVDDALSDFKEILKQAAGEINMENALNLTLDKDAGQFISDLKDVVKSGINPDESAVESLKDSNFDYITAVLNENKNINNEPVKKKDKDNENVALSLGITVINDAVADNSIQKNNDVLTNSLNKVSDSSEFIKFTYKEAELAEEDSQNNVPDREMLKELNIESIESDTDSSQEQSFLNNKQTPEEHGVKALLHAGGEKFDINLLKQSENLNRTTNLQDINPSRIIEQITKQLDSAGANSKVNIILNPESLGRVDLQIINTKEGLSAQFTVATNEARDLIMKGLDGLKESLLAHGVGVDNISVKISEAEETSYNQDWTEQEGSRGGNKDNGENRKEEKEKGLFEKTIAKNLKDETKNV